MKKNIDYKAPPLQVFLRYFRPHRRLFAVDMLCAVAVALIDLLFPFVSRRCMQVYLPAAAYRTFFIVMAVVVAAYLLKSVLYYVITVVGHYMGVLVETDMRRDIFLRMMSQPPTAMTATGMMPMQNSMQAMNFPMAP